MSGRGTLGRYGPNHAAQCIVTRWSYSRDKQGKLHLRKDKFDEKILEVALATRLDGTLQFPGLAVPPATTFEATLRKSLVGWATAPDGEVGAAGIRRLNRSVDELFATGAQMEGFIVQDSRNTDNAWIEMTTACFHDETGKLTSTLKLGLTKSSPTLNKHSTQSGIEHFEPGTIVWLPIEAHMPLPAASLKMLADIRAKRLAKEEHDEQSITRWKLELQQAQFRRAIASGLKHDPEKFVLRLVSNEYFTGLNPDERIGLMACLRPIVDDPSHPVGMIAAEARDYGRFWPVFSQLLASYRSDPTSSSPLPESDWETKAGGKHGFNLSTLMQKANMSCPVIRVRVSRNICCFPLQASMGVSDRKNLETLCCKAFDWLCEHTAYTGKYISLDIRHERYLEPSELSKLLVKDDITFMMSSVPLGSATQTIKTASSFKTSKDTRRMKAGNVSHDRTHGSKSGALSSSTNSEGNVCVDADNDNQWAARDWPVGRGIYISSDKSFAIWVGEKDHVKVVAMSRDHDMLLSFNKAHAVINAFEQALRAVASRLTWEEIEQFGMAKPISKKKKLMATSAPVATMDPETIFTTIDRNKDGRLTMFEIKKFLKQNPDFISDLNLREDVMAEADTDGTNNVSLDEWLLFVKKHKARSEKKPKTFKLEKLWHHNKTLGFLTSSPTNCGHGVCVSMQVRVGCWMNSFFHLLLCVIENE